MDANEKLIKILGACDALVGYAPMGDEPDAGEFLKTHAILAHGSSVLPLKNLSPQKSAQELLSRHLGKKVCIFIPGRAFDKSGTRHGRGGGWYDRFLSALPKEWIRIGVASSREIHEDGLERQPWDEPVDFILVKDGTWSVVHTNARVL